MKHNTVRIDLQNDDHLPGVPDVQQFESWVIQSLMGDYPQLEQTIRVVGEDESRELNHLWRSKNSPTNVLSFPAENSEFLDYDVLGDLVICAPVVAAEAAQQNKELQAHWAHMVVHGMLHLQGFDHITDSEAEQMESREIEILAALGQTNPYST